MPVTRLNHAVLYVRDVQATRDFYEQVLGFRTLIWMPGQAAFFQAPASTNDHDLGVFQIGSGAGPSSAGRTTVGLYHLAWEVDTLAELRRIAGLLAERDALVGASDHFTTKALYARDPDGIEFEVSWLVPGRPDHRRRTRADRQRRHPPPAPRHRRRDRPLRRRHTRRRRHLGRRALASRRADDCCRLVS